MCITYWKVYSCNHKDIKDVPFFPKIQMLIRCLKWSDTEVEPKHSDLFCTGEACVQTSEQTTRLKCPVCDEDNLDELMPSPRSSTATSRWEEACFLVDDCQRRVEAERYPDLKVDEDRSQEAAAEVLRRAREDLRRRMTQDSIPEEPEEEPDEDPEVEEEFEEKGLGNSPEEMV